MKVGILIAPEHVDLDQYCTVWESVDRLGADSLWTWDHAYALHGDISTRCLDPIRTLCATSALTHNARQAGVLVLAAPVYTHKVLIDNAALLAALFNGRYTVGLGTGYLESDFDAHDVPFGTRATRLESLERAAATVDAAGVPLLVGGAGPATLRCAARHADYANVVDLDNNWNTSNAVIDAECGRIGRDPAAIERTLLAHSLAAVLDAKQRGCAHIIYELLPPFDLTDARAVIAAVRA